MKKDKTEKFIKKWSKYRRVGKEEYVNKTSIQTGVAILVGISISRLYRGELGFFNLPNLILFFVVGYISSRIGATRTWKRNEYKYSKLINNVEK
ncbi:MAG: hypothetical protein JJT76_19885 [Clostridiaceae bacterium]|nr:hypothetical protein [Clostridiaceae bacterium]